VVERDGREQLVHFWFRSARSPRLLNAWEQAWDQIVARLRTDRADGSLVRLSADLEGSSVERERSRLLRFAAILEPQLADHWPTESPPALDPT
jgi:hypothetical protein